MIDDDFLPNDMYWAGRDICWENYELLWADKSDTVKSNETIDKITLPVNWILSMVHTE